jgi:hypothetical protein
MAEYDNKAFNAMNKATENEATSLFTESEYNTLSSGEERAAYDVKAHDILLDMWNSDRVKNKFKNIDFDRYVDLLKPELFEQRALSRKGGQELGDFFLNVYEGDFDQFKASALRAIPKTLSDDVESPRKPRPVKLPSPRY